MIANEVSVDSYKNMPRQLLENKLTKPSLSILPSSSIDIEHKRKLINGAFDGNYVEYKSDTDEESSIKEYLEKNRPHIQDLINYFKKFCAWKIELTIKPKFISSTAINEEHTMYSVSL